MEITFLEFYSELTRFKNWVAYKTDLRRARLDREDFIGFANEKIFDVWYRYNGKLDKATMMAVAKTSLYKLPLYLNAKYGKLSYKEYSNREEETLAVESIPSPEPEPANERDYEREVLDVLAWGFDGLSTEEINMIKLIITPPPYILSRVKNPSKRIPSKLFLEFLDIPTTSQNVAKLNNYRRAIFKEALELKHGVQGLS